jgi:hypothetical protein
MKSLLTIGQFIEGIIGGIATYIIIYIFQERILDNEGYFVTGCLVTFGWASIWWVRKISLRLFDSLPRGKGYKKKAVFVIILLSILCIYLISRYIKFIDKNINEIDQIIGEEDDDFDEDDEVDELN